MRSEKKKRRKKASKFRLLLCILAVVLLICLAVFLVRGCANKDTQPSDTELPSQNQPADSQSPDDSQNSDDTQSPDDTDSGEADRPHAPASTEPRTEDDGDLFVLVNKQYSVSSDYEPADMVDIDGSLSTNQNLKVKREAYDAYLKMLEDAKKEGLNFAICSAYRTYDLQKSLYDNSLAANGKEYTEKMFAYPGQSEHHTGYAIDITSASMNWGLSQDFINYPDGAWITEHCSEYGFIIRYLKGKEDITGYMYEPWHIRYIGLEAAKEITEQGITLEEYLGAV